MSSLKQLEEDMKQAARDLVSSVKAARATGLPPGSWPYEKVARAAWEWAIQEELEKSKPPRRRALSPCPHGLQAPECPICSLDIEPTPEAS